MSDFVTGANDEGFHLTGVNWERDLPTPSQIHDLRNVVEGDPSPDGRGKLSIARGIEVGHIFQLGTKYSEAMKATVVDENSRYQTMIMGCYGIGVSRIVAACIEQNHDERGIVWPSAMAPFQIALCPVNLHRSERLRMAVDELYERLRNAGYDVLLDDRQVRTGFMFADMELIGIPHRLVLSDKGLDAHTYEYRGRRDSESTEIPEASLMEFL